jgi:hypothetical protein
MKPTEGKCEDCKHIIKGMKIPYQQFLCTKTTGEVKGWWTGCVMWERREE